MVRIFKHYVPYTILFLGMVEMVILLASVYAGLYLRNALTHAGPWDLLAFLPEALAFTGIVGVTMFSLGLYQREYLRSIRTVMVRLATSCTIAFVVLSLLFYLVPQLTIWRSVLVIALMVTMSSILLLRVLFLRVTHLDRFKRRILVIGAGPRAARIEAFERNGDASFVTVGYLPVDDANIVVSPDRAFLCVESLVAYAQYEGIEQIVIAVEDHRGSMPTRSLLECKLNGIEVTEYTTFWERETGAVDLAALNPSWLIYSDGFCDSKLRNLLMRACDIGASLFVLVFTLPLLLATAAAIVLESGGPVFYRQERIGRGGRPFMLIKFRSMCVDAEADGVPRWSGEGDSRITRVGAFIRATRVDEIPQVFNVLRGDMSLVGPRPERQYFVEQLTGDLPYYPARHRIKPGITGWAQLNFKYGSSARDAGRKLEYDLYYLKNYSFLLYLVILVQTARVVFWPHSARSACAPETITAIARLKSRRAA